MCSLPLCNPVNQIAVPLTVVSLVCNNTPSAKIPIWQVNVLLGELEAIHVGVTDIVVPVASVTTWRLDATYLVLNVSLTIVSLIISTSSPLLSAGSVEYAEIPSIYAINL